MPKISLYNGYHYALCFMAFSFSFPSTFFPFAIGVLALTGVLLRFKTNDKSIDKQLMVLYLLLFGYMAIRIIGNVDVRYGFRVLERNLPLLLIPLLVIPNKLKKPKEFYKSFIFGISIAALIAMIGVGYYQLFADKEDTGWYFTAIADYGFHPTYMAMYALIAIIMLSEKRLFAKRWTMVLNVLLSVFILFTSSRIALITLFLLIVIKAIVSRKKNFYYALGLTSVLLVAMFSFSEDFRYKVNQLKDFKGFSYYDNDNYGSVSVRVAKIKASILVWKENKWFGNGTGDFRETLVQKYRSPEIECWPCARERYNSHNQYLNVLGAYGIIGLLFYGSIIIYLLYKAWKTKNSLLLGVLFIFLIISLTESILEVQRGVVIVFFLLYYIPLANRIEDGL